mgnify:CR=1 FL=1
MVEFKDDGTATTPGKPRENRDAESAVVADLVAVELDDAGLNLNTKRLPILARIYGAVVLLDGLATLPIMVISILYAVREILDGHVHVDAMSLTFILSAIHAVVLVVSAACLIVFGVMLLRNHRRYAARWTYVLMPLTLADGMLSLALTAWLQPAAAADSDDYSRRDFGDRRSLPERGTPSAARAQAHGRSR